MLAAPSKKTGFVGSGEGAAAHLAGPVRKVADVEVDRGMLS